METRRLGAGTRIPQEHRTGQEEGTAEPSPAVSPGAEDGPGLTELLLDLRAGVPWEIAYAAHRGRVASNGRAMPSFPDRRINFTWLTDLDRTACAVDLGSAFGNLAADLALEFGEVRYVGGRGPHASVAAARLEGDRHVHLALSEAEHAALPEDTADLAVFAASHGWRARVPARVNGPRDLVRMGVGLLRPGGWIGLLQPNPLWHRWWTTDPAGPGRIRRYGSMLRAFRETLRELGVSEVREFLVAPDLDVPTAFVPRTRSAALAYLRSVHAPEGELWIGRMGFHAALFPVLLVLAKR